MTLLYFIIEDGIICPNEVILKYSHFEIRGVKIQSKIFKLTPEEEEEA